MYETRIGSGDRVAHRTLDNKLGSASAGVAEQVIGDDAQQLVVVHEESGELTAYDRRELVSLGKQSRTHGPVILSLHHLFHILKRLPALLAFSLALISGIALNVFAARGEWSSTTIGLASIGVLIVCLVLFTLLERRLSVTDE